MQHFRLRYRAHDIELPPGEFVVGRSEDCQLSLDDAMVSRRHAVFRVTATAVVLADLESRNGVMVNGERVVSERQLTDGDRVTIGKHALLFSIAPDSIREYKLLQRTLGPIELEELESAPKANVLKIVSAFSTLSSLADKTLVLGRPQEAERILSVPLNDLMKELQRGVDVDGAILAPFAVYALKLAHELQKAQWIHWILDAYAARKTLMPAQLIDELFSVAPKLKHLGRQPLLDYVAVVSEGATLTPNERFLVQRIESLARRLATMP